jgi:O-antigen/teichoic acid export membrane protein
MLFAMGSKALYAVSRVALPPLTLSYVGLAEYGLWATCFVIVSYLGMTASGFALVYLRKTAQWASVGDTAAISRLLSTGIFTMAAAAASLLGLLWLALPWLLDVFQVAPDQRPLATQLWMGACAVFLADMSLGAFGSVLHAVNRVRQEQTVWIASYLFETACIVGMLLAGWGIFSLLAAFGARYLLACLANGVLVFRALPGLRISPTRYDKSLLGAFFSTGAVMQLSGLLATALHSADKVMAGAVLGPQATAVFDLATKLPITAASAPSGVSGVAVGAAARADARGDRQGVREVFADASSMTVVTLGLMLPFMAAFAALLTQAWLGVTPVQQQVAPVMAALCVGLCWHMMTGPASAICRGVGQLSAEFVYHGLRVACFSAAGVAWLVLGAGQLLWLAMAIACAQCVAASIYLLWSWRLVTGQFGGVWEALFRPMLAALAVAWGLQAAWPWHTAHDRWHALLALAGAGACWLILFGLTAWCLMLSPATRVQVKARVLKLLGKHPRPNSWSLP